MVLCDFGNRSGQAVAGNAGTDCERGALVFLEGLVQEVAQMTQRIEENHLQTLSPLLAYSIYKAASIVSVKLKDDTHIDKLGTMKALKAGLELISRRWRVAG